MTLDDHDNGNDLVNKYVVAIACADHHRVAVCGVQCDLCAALNPLEALGRVSLYNVVLPGRERLPYGEDSAKSYNLSTYNLPAMFASHVIARPKADDEFRVIVIGDSGTWGWLLNNEDTLAGQINAQNLDDGRWQTCGGVQPRLSRHGVDQGCADSWKKR